MKIKKLLIIIVLLLYNCVTILAHTHEIWIENKTGSTNLFIKFYPYGSLYNGGEIVYSNTIDYSLQKTSDGITFPTLRRANPLGTGEPILYIVGLDGLALDGRRGNYPGYFMLNYEGSFSDKSCLLGNDATITGQDEVDGIFGYGLYILEVYSLSNLENPIEQIKIDWRDFNYPHYPSGLQMQADLQINYYNVNSNSLDIRYVWGSGTGAGIEKNLYEDSTANGHLEVYNQYYGNRTPNLLIPNKNNAVSDTRSNFFKYPINATRIPNRYATYIHENPGDLGMNLEVNHDVTMIDTISQSTNILIPSNGYLKIGSGRTFNMTTAVGGSINLTIQDSSSLLMEYSSHLIVGNHNMLSLKSRGSISFISPSDVPFAEIIIDSGATFCNEGGTINGVIITYKKSVNPHLFCATVQDVFYNDSTKIVLADSAVMEIPDGVTMHFSGIKSGLIMKPNSKLMLGVGCKIILDSSASFVANGATFTSLDSTLKWDGIVLNNSDADTITNCTFSNAITALTITNDANTAYKNRIITNNTFNVPSGGIYKGIYGENNYKILLKGNTFNMPVYYPSASPVPLIYVGVYLKNSSTIEAAGGDIEEDQATNYSLNILENTFSNGCASVILVNYTSNYLPYIISDNTFNNTASVNIIGMNITGTIRDNTFTSEDVPLGIHLINSSPNLFKNTINSRDVGLHLAGHCYPNLAPYVSGEDLVWTGGNNYITTTDIDNIQLSSSGYVNTDFGNNNFTVDNSSSYHIYGWLDSAHSIYKTRDNCWNSSNTSRIYLKTYGSVDTIPVPVLNTNNYSCTGEITPTGWIVFYNGNDEYDSIKISNNYTGEQPSDEEILYAQALADYNNNFDVQAITDFKYLIDNYPDIEKLPEILYEFYRCYQSLDTNEGQNYREPLYQDIIDYLNDKILSDEYNKNEEFSDNAYDIILMAQSIIDLNAAAGGYEFLAFNHPDPNIRLTASWNYAEIEELINSGNGGGNKLQVSSDKLQIEEQDQLNKLNELKDLNELISDDPVMSKLKRAFDKTSLERKERLDKQISRETKNGEALNDKLRRSLQIDIQKEERAKRNVFELRNATKEEKENRRIEDLALTTIGIRNENNREEKVSIPLQYRLEQNYPNPFNPITNLEFGIPELGFVSLKVYDVLGKEVRTLVNEIKPPGMYNIVFDGSNLASGIYFYKLVVSLSNPLEAGSFTQTKRMLLVK